MAEQDVNYTINKLGNILGTVAISAHALQKMIGMICDADGDDKEFIAIAAAALAREIGALADVSAVRLCGITGVIGDFEDWAPGGHMDKT